MNRPDEIADYVRFANGDESPEQYCHHCHEGVSNGTRLTHGRDEFYFCMRHNNDAFMIEVMGQYDQIKPYQILEMINKQEIL